MKALSVQQPWAWLIVNGYKPLENRNWDTKFRGEFYIHAGKKFDKGGYEWASAEFPHIKMPQIDEFERGGIVGKATLINTVHKSVLYLLCNDDEPWFFGEYGFMLDNASRLPFMPYKGQLGFFEVKL